VAVILQTAVSGHVTIRSSGPLSTSGYATVSIAVPNERHVDTVRLLVDVTDAFLEAGGRISKVEYPADWTVRLEKRNKPDAVYARESADRAARNQARSEESASQREASPEAEAAIEAARKQWIKRLIFEGGAIPPDGFKEFRLSLQLPDKPGRYRFPTRQVYADGVEVAWVQIVEGADRPAPELTIAKPWGQAIWWIMAGAVALGLAALIRQRRRRWSQAVNPDHLVRS
jgi:hypothetical protein